MQGARVSSKGGIVVAAVKAGSKLTKLTERSDRMGVPVEGWLHFRVIGVHENEVGATVYRLNVLTPSGAVSTDILGKRNLAAVGGAEFQKLPFAARSGGSVDC